MSHSNPVNRRQFVKSSITAAGLAALAATGSACPVSYDGTRGDWWCIYDRDTSDPQIWIYYWKNCNTGAYTTTMGAPGLPLGKCPNAANDPGCINAKVINDWERITIGETTVRIPPDIDTETRDAGIRLITARAEGF